MSLLPADNTQRDLLTHYMKRKRRTRFTVWAILGMLAARAADIGVTYHYSPDLFYEGNPAVLIFHAGWKFLIVANLLVVALVSACLLYWWRQPLMHQPVPEVKDVWSFASHTYFGRVHRRLMLVWHVLFSRPRNWRCGLQLLGVTLPPMIIVCSAGAVYTWVALHTWRWEGYLKVYHALCPFFPYGFMIPAGILAQLLFFKTEYQRYQRASAPEEAASGTGEIATAPVVP
jgi:hypothetical protein